MRSSKQSKIPCGTSQRGTGFLPPRRALLLDQQALRPLSTWASLGKAEQDWTAWPLTPAPGPSWNRLLSPVGTRGNT